MSKKKLTTGQRLAYMLRTAVVEAQAVERGAYPKFRLNMMDFGSETYDGVCEVCLAGVYAILGKGQIAPWGPDGGDQRRDISDYEYALDSLRTGRTFQASISLGLEPLRNDTAAEAARKLILSDYDQAACRASWNTYLKAADILEKA